MTIGTKALIGLAAGPAACPAALPAVDPVPNAFRTVANVTGMLAAAVIVDGKAALPRVDPPG